MRTRAPAAGTLPPSQVAGADHGPLRAERMTDGAGSLVVFGGSADSREMAAMARPSRSTAASGLERRMGGRLLGGVVGWDDCQFADHQPVLHRLTPFRESNPVRGNQKG